MSVVCAYIKSLLISIHKSIIKVKKKITHPSQLKDTLEETYSTNGIDVTDLAIGRFLWMKNSFFFLLSSKFKPQNSLQCKSLLNFHTSSCSRVIKLVMLHWFSFCNKRSKAAYDKIHRKFYNRVCIKFEIQIFRIVFHSSFFFLNLQRQEDMYDTIFELLQEGTLIKYQSNKTHKKNCL